MGRKPRLNSFHELIKAESEDDEQPRFSAVNIAEYFMNKSPVRLTLKGLKYFKKTNLLGKPFEVNISNIPEPSPKELKRIYQKTKFPFYLDKRKFVTFDPKCHAILALMDYDFGLFIKGSKK